MMAIVFENTSEEKRFIVCDHCGWKKEHGTKTTYPFSAPPGWIRQYGDQRVECCGPECFVNMVLKDRRVEVCLHGLELVERED